MHPSLRLDLGRIVRFFLEIRGFVGSPLSSDEIDDSQTGDRRLCYKTQFAPLIDLMTPSQFNQYFRSTSETKDVTRQLKDWQRAAFHIAQTTFDGEESKRLYAAMPKYVYVHVVYVLNGMLRKV